LLPLATHARALVRRSGAFLLYVLLAVASFYPQSVRPRDTVAYTGDSLESVYIVAWNVHQLFRAPVHLFEANVLHPQRRALAFTDHRLLPSIAVAPLVWLTGNPVLAYNVAVAGACLLAAFGARRLARLLGAGAVAAWAAGALYGFHTYQVNEAPRLNIVCHGFIPFALSEVVLYLRRGERRHAWRTAGFLLLQGLSSNYHLLYGSFLVGLVVAGALFARPAVVARRLPRLAAAALAAGLLYVPLAVPYVRNAREHGFERALPTGIDLQHYVSTAPGNLLYGPVGAEVRLQQRGPHFVGFVALGLGLLAVVAWVRRRGETPSAAVGPEPALPPRIWVPAAAALAVLFVALSAGKDLVAFGHHLGPGPYRILHLAVPGFQMVRIPERLGLLAMLFVALLAARGLTLLDGRGLRLPALVLAGLLPLEHVSILPVHQRVPVTRRIPEVYRWLQRTPTGPLAEVPIRGEGLVREETIEMYFAGYHFRPILHGYTAYPPLLSRHLRRLAAQFPSEVALQGLQRVGVGTVVVHHGRPLGGDLARRLRDTGEFEPARFGRLLREAGLDLYDRLPAAVAAGRIHREARFEGPNARLLDSGADEVYRIHDLDRYWPSAPFPGGRPLRDPAWTWRAKVGDPRLAADGRLDTSWRVPRFLLGDEFLEVTFGGPVQVSGLVLPLRRDSAFPTRFRVAGRREDGRWVEVARFDDAHALQLLDRLREDPRRASIGFDLGGRSLWGLSLLVEEAGTSFEGWSLPEMEVRVP
jgi:hypothetical protein